MSRIDALRERLGGAHPLAATKVKDHLEPSVENFIRRAPFLVMASSNAGGDCDASPKGGLPGWVQILDAKTLLLPDIGGNRLFQTYQNFESNPKVGLVFMIPGCEITARVNGGVEVLEPQNLASRGITPQLAWRDANSGFTQGIVVHVDEAYLHCPRAFKFADLWSTATITENAKRPVKEFLSP